MQHSSRPGRAPRRGRARRRAARLLAAAALAALPASLSAQPVLGAGEDATIPRRGHVRLGLGVGFEGWSEGFGADGGRVPAGARASLDTIGVRLFPALLPVRDSLRALTGSAALGLSLGTLRTEVRAVSQVLPIVAEVGILDRVSLSVRVPVVRTRSSVLARLNEGESTANVGVNATAGRAANVALVNAIGTAATTLGARVASCAAAPDAPGCAGFDPRVAAALVTDATALGRRIATVYGTGEGTPGLPVVPLVGSAAQQAVQARIADLSARFAAFGVRSLAPDLAPAAAGARIGVPGFQTRLADPASAIASDSLRGVGLQGVGDVDLAATVQWLDTFRGDERARLAPAGLQLRSAMTAGFRLGTGGGDFPDVYFGIPTGTGANALLFRSATDVVLGRRAWGSVVVRYAHPFAATRFVRVPSVADEFFVPAARTAEIQRTPGRELQVELTPRYAFGQFFSVWGQYRLRSKQEDRHTGAVPLLPSAEVGGANLDASLLDAGTDGSEQRAGIGVSYSSVAAYTRGTSNLPLEVSWLLQRSVVGSGGAYARATGQQVQVRVYFQTFGARERRRSGVR